MKTRGRPPIRTRTSRLLGLGTTLAGFLWLPTLAAGQTDTSVIISGPAGHALDSVLTRYASYGFAGSVLVAKGGTIILSKGYGLADRISHRPNTPGTLFEIGSITKTFTAAAILQLESQGRLRTTDSLSSYLGPFPAAKAAATIHHLATHTAGLLQDGALLEDVSTRDRFIESVKRTAPESPPGEHYRYTNAGYSVLAALVEVVSGQTYEDYVRQHLFAPAGLASAGFRGANARSDARLARGYLGPPGETRESLAVDLPWGTRGAGGIIASVPDLYRWVLALADTLVLSDSAREKMFYPRPNEGYAWRVTTDSSGLPFISKGGGMPQYAGHILRYPSEDLVIIWASNNLQQRWRQALNRGLTAMALSRRVELPPAQVRLSPTGLGRMAVSCRASEGGGLTLRTGNGFLYAETNPLGLPLDMPFFSTAREVLTGFDPSTGGLLTLRFSSQFDALDVALSDGRRLSLRC